jgi:SAM-dependent methyltransferase
VTLTVKEIAASLNFEDVAEALEQSRWIYAKTMPECPHFYTLRKEWASPVPWEPLVQYIRDNGYREKFGRTWFTRLDVNNFKYWTMAPPIILINRAEIDRPEPYDAIAPVYEALRDTPVAASETRAVADALNYSGGSVLDIGCGTGLLLDLIAPDEYLGIDPSQGMLDTLKRKHPLAETIHAKFEAFYAGRRRFDIIVGLFGSPSYIEPNALARLPSLLAPGGRYFLMFYGQDYRPEEHLGQDIPFHNWRNAANYLPDARVSKLGNFMVLRS